MVLVCGRVRQVEHLLEILAALDLAEQEDR